MPPTIKSRAFDNDETIEVGPDGMEVFVAAQDADEDTVSFVWTFKKDGFVGDAEYFRQGIEDGPDLQVGIVFIEWDGDPDREGEELRVDIFDATNDTIRLSWPVEML